MLPKLPFILELHVHEGLTQLSPFTGDLPRSLAQLLKKIGPLFTRLVAHGFFGRVPAPVQKDQHKAPSIPSQ